MEDEGRVWLKATPARVWAAMTDPEVLRVCVPGCKAVDRRGPGDFRFDINGRWGVLKARFFVQVHIHDLEPADAPTPLRYSLSAHGEGALGLARGLAHVELRAQETGTYLCYRAEGAPDADLGKLGRPVLRHAAQVLSKKFFTRFSNAVAGLPAK
jgi:hypothetical protein